MMLAAYGGYFAAAVGTLRAPVVHRALRIAPVASGDGTGSSWANAASIGQLNNLAAIAGAIGSEIWIAAHLGPYAAPVQLSLTNGGTVERPLVIRGVDAAGNDMHARIIGTRAFPWTSPASKGIECLWLSGASNVALRFLRFEHLGIAMRVRAACANLDVSDIECFNVSRFLQNNKGNLFAHATISGLKIARCSADYVSKTFIFLRYDTHGVHVEDCIVDFRSIDNDWISCGFQLYDTAHDVTWLRCVGRNVYNSGPGTYWNGDIFSTENDNDDVRFLYCEGYDATDRIYDCKGTNHYWFRCRAERAKRNWCIWGSGVLEECVGVEPLKRGGSASSAQVVALKGGRCIVKRSTFTASANTNAPFRTLDNGFLYVDAATQAAVVKPAGAPMFSTEGEIDIQYGTLDYADHTPPVSTSSLVLSMPENKVVRFTTSWSEHVTLRLRGPDAAVVNLSGRQLVLGPLDYEKEGGVAADGSNVLKFEVQAIDRNENTSAWLPATITVTDQPDAPIAPAEMVTATGCSDAVIYRLNYRHSVWADFGRTVQAEIDGPVAIVDDLSGFGHHAVFDPEKAVLRLVGGCLKIDFRGDFSGKIGVPGDCRWPQQTSIVGVTRNVDENEDGSIPNDYILHTARRQRSDTGGNSAFTIGFSGTQSVIYRSTPSSSSGTTPGVGARRNTPVVIAYRPTSGSVRSNGIEIASPPPVAANTYPVNNDQPLWGGRLNVVETFFNGFSSGFAWFNVDVPDVGLLNRIEREVARWEGAAI